MNYKAIEYSLKSVEPGIWKYKFRIGRGIKTGTTKTKLDLVAIHRVQSELTASLKTPDSTSLRGKWAYLSACQMIVDVIGDLLADGRQF